MSLKYCDIKQNPTCGDLHACIPEDYGMNLITIRCIQDDENEYGVNNQYILWDTLEYPPTLNVRLGIDFVADTCIGCDKKLIKCICHTK